MEIVKKRPVMRLVTPLVILIMIAVSLGPAGTIVLAQTDNVTDNITDITDNVTDNITGRGKGRIPPGQMIRSGLVGQIVAVGDNGTVFIQTNFGLVEVFVGIEAVDESLIGQRMAVKLAKTPGGASGFARGETSGNITGGGGATDNASGGLEVYRVATAEQFKVIPGKAAKKHLWGTIEDTESGSTFIDDEGNSIPVEGGALGDSGGQVVGLITDNQTDAGGFTFVAYENTSKIEARITARIAKAEGEGDTKALGRLQQQLERYQEKQEERQVRAEAVAAKRADKSQQDKGQGQSQGKDKGADQSDGQSQGQGKGQDNGQAGGASDDKGGGKGKN